MDENKDRDQAASRIGADSFLADFAAPLPQVAERGKGNIGDRMKSLAGALGKINKGSVQITLGAEENAPRWNFQLASGGAKIAEGAHAKPDLEIITSEDVWSQIVGGQLSP